MIRILLLSLLLLGCAQPKTEFVYIKPNYSIPEKPDLPIVNSEELKCLSIETKKKLVARDRGWKEYTEILKVILEKNKE